MFERRILRGICLALIMAAGCRAATELEGSPFEKQAARAFLRIDSLRETSKILASALEGENKSSIEDAHADLSQLAVNQPTIVALGQGGMAALLEAHKPGSGLGQIALASRMAGSDFGIHWALVLGMVRNHSPKGVSVAVTGMESSMLSQGWQRMPEASAWLLNLASDAEQNAMADSLRACAKRIDPVSPVPDFAIANHKLSDLDFQGWYDALRASLLKAWIYPQNQLLISLNLLRAIRMIGLLTAFFVFIGLMVRYWPWISHNAAERLPLDSSIYLRYGALAVGFVSLLLAGLGVHAFFLLGSLLLWKHLSSKERGFLGALILFIGSQGFLTTIEEVLARHFDMSSRESLLLRSAEEGYSPQLSRLLQEHPEPVAKSIQALKSGDLFEAGKVLTPGDIDPILGPIQTGNIAFVRGAMDSAGRQYSRAFLADAENPALPYNRGQVASWQGHTDSLNPLLKSATLAGAQRFDLTVSQNSRLFTELPSNRTILSPELSDKETWRRVGEALSDPSIWLEGNGSSGLLEIPFVLLPWVSLGLLVWLTYTSKPRNLARDLFRCKTCGRVMCRHCRRGLHCHSCFRRLSTVNELELRNELLMRLEREGQQRERLLLRILDITLPGTGSFAQSPNVLSVIKMLTLALSLSLLLNLPGIISRYPFSQSSPGQLPFILILVALYGSNLFVVLRHPKVARMKG